MRKKLDLYNEITSGNQNSNDMFKTITGKDRSSVTKEYNLSPTKTSDYLKEQKPKTTKSKSLLSGYVKKGALSDGYQIGDLTKTVVGTLASVEQNAARGISKATEGILDTGLWGVGKVAELLGQDKLAGATKKIIAKDITGEGKQVENITGLSSITQAVNDILNGRVPYKRNIENIVAPTKKALETSKKDLTVEQAIDDFLTNYQTEEDKKTKANTILGEKAEGLVQSGAQMLGTQALQTMTGIPWWITMGASTFGSQTEEAFNEGANYNQAGMSALVSAIGEVLTEKISGGIKFGGKTLDDGLKSYLTRGISNKVLNALTQFGFDVVGEGSEEVLSNIITRLGKKLTYEKDKTWKELLTSEEAVDSYIQDFIGGAIMGGVGNIPHLASSIKTGRNYETRLTQEEQKVVDTEVDNRIGDRKVSEKELTKIENEVKRDLEKGYISQDTISQALNEDYKQIEDYNKKQKRLEELLDKKVGETTNRENSEIKALQEELDKIDINDLRSKINQNTATKIGKESILQSTYNEQYNKSQKYDADLSKYNEKEQKIVQKAIDSGVLNNTNKTHDLIDMLAKLSSDKNIDFDFTNNQKLKDSGFALDADINGFVKDGNITLNIDSKNALNSVVGHEITHILEGTELYDTLQQSVENYAKTKGINIDERLAKLQDLYKNVKDANVRNELTSDLVGEYLFTDTDFVKNLSTEQPNLFKKIYNEIKYMLKVVTAGSKEERELLKVQKAFEEAYRDTRNVKEGTQYSLTQDNQGRKLTEQQQEYFKDSKVRDEEGNLLELYHGTQNYDFNEFEGGTFLTDDYMNADGYAAGERVIAAYVNMEKPLVIECNGAKWDNLNTPYGTSTREIASKLDESKYDGIIFKNINDNWIDDEDAGYPGDVYYVPNSNQIKNIDNENPTDNPDIRYSIGNDLTNVNNGIYGEDIKLQEQLETQPTQVQEVQSIETTQETPIQETQEVKPIAPVREENPLTISRLTPEDANTTPKLPQAKASKGEGKSRTISNITDTAKMLTKEQQEIIKSADIGGYEKVTNKQSLERAFKKLNEGGRNETLSWMSKDSKNANATDVAEGWILLKQYADNGDTDGLVATAKKMKEMATNSAQTLQAFNIMERLTPEGMVAYAQSELLDAYNEMVKNKSQKWIDKYRSRFELTGDEVQFIMDNMKEVSQMEDGYDKQVKLAEIQKIMTDKLPPEKGQRIKSWMRLSMLFNPKTQVRNVAGNAVIAPVNYFGDIFASAADYLVAKKTNVRTTGNINVKAMLKGLKDGAYQSTMDYRKGINTRDMEGNRFEIGQNKSFSNDNLMGKSLNMVEGMLNYVMDAGDRVFSQSAFENSLQNQMKLNNVTKPTQEMIDIARKEALSRTWNDNNNYTNLVLNIRKNLNKIGTKNFGLGDVLIPFAKTPANLTKAIVDYSPAGFVNTLVKGNNLRKAIETNQFTPQMQHEFAQSLGKATAGTMLYVLGAALASAGVISGESDEDKDTANFLKNTLGINSYSIKLGNKSFTFDWAQPVAAPLAITANLKGRDKEGQALLEGVIASMDTASSVLLEQSFLTGIKEVLDDNNGIVNGMVNEVLKLPARAIPTFSKQIADLVDGTQRQTYVKGDPKQSAINSAKAKIPFVSKTLAPSVDTMGRNIEKYGGKNNLFNVFLNPANVATENVSESAKKIYDVYKETGDKTIMPRVAPYSITTKDKSIELTPEQRTAFQRESGKIIENNVALLTNDPQYNSLNNTEKAEVLSNITNYAYNKARQDVLDIPMANTYNKVNEYVAKGGNVADYYLDKKEINYSLQNENKYKTLSAFMNYDDYTNYAKKISSIKDTYSSENGYESADRKQQVVNYIEGLNLSIPQKVMLLKEAGGYGIGDYKNYMYNYINNLDLTKSQKEEIYYQLYPKR